MAKLGLRKYYQTYRPNFPMYEFLIDAFCKSTLACCKKYNLDKSADLPIEVVSVGSGVILFAPIVQDFRAGKIKLKKNRVDEQPDNVVKETKMDGTMDRINPETKKPHRSAITTYLIDRFFLVKIPFIIYLIKTRLRYKRPFFFFNSTCPLFFPSIITKQWRNLYV